MVDPQVQAVSSAVRTQIEQRDVRGLAVLGGIGALGVIGIREVIDRLDGRAGITADPTNAQEHAINGLAKIIIAGLLIVVASRSGMGDSVMALAGILSFGALVSAGGNAIDAIGRARLAQPVQSSTSSGGSSSGRQERRASTARATQSGNGSLMANP